MEELAQDGGVSLEGLETTPEKLLEEEANLRHTAHRRERRHEESLAQVGVAAPRDPGWFVHRSAGLELDGIEAGPGDPLLDPHAWWHDRELAEELDRRDLGDARDREQQAKTRSQLLRAPDQLDGLSSQALDALVDLLNVGLDVLVQPRRVLKRRPRGVQPILLLGACAYQIMDASSDLTQTPTGLGG